MAQVVEAPLVARKRATPRRPRPSRFCPSNNNRSLSSWRARPRPEPLSTSPLQLVDRQLITIEPASELAAVYAERFKLIAPNVGPDEGRLRAFEHAVGVCRNHYRVDLETAKLMTADAIKQARAKGPV
jgi:hypothetical protein